MGSNPGYDDELAPTHRLPALDPWGRPVDQPQGPPDAAPYPPPPNYEAPFYSGPTYQAPQYPAPPVWGQAPSQPPPAPAYGPPTPYFAPPGPNDVPVAPGAPAPAWWPPASYVPPPRPATHVVGAALATVLLCWPLGAVALANALRVDDLWRAGDVAGARRASDRARAWTVWAVLAGLVWLTLWAGVALALR